MNCRLITKATTVVWFRNCLRLHDNSALFEASKSCRRVVCIFVFNPSVYDPKCMGINRFNFLLESLEDLKQQLNTQYGGDLILFETKSSYLDFFATLLKNNTDSIKEILYEHDRRILGKKRDESISAFLKNYFPEVGFTSFQGHTLSDITKVTKQQGFKKPSNMKMCQNLMIKEFGTCESVTGINIPPPLERPRMLDFNLNFLDEIKCSSRVLKRVPQLNELHEIFGDAFRDVDAEIVKKNSYFKGGETEALNRLKNKVVNGVDYVCDFKKPLTSCTSSPESLFREPSTTGLSPYLAHGCLSVRWFWKVIDEAYKKKNNPEINNLAMSLFGQVLFREMYYIINEASGEKFFENTKENPVITKYVNWNEHDPILIKAWENGQTGYPFIDALMRQLKATGWMHHLGRHAVSCFFTRGQMYQDWTHGRDIFDRLLVDSDYAVNTGNWLWLSGTAVYSMPYFRVYNPCPKESKINALNFNEGGNDFIRYWVPELINFPADYLTNPWDCPFSDQKACGVVIGKDYPRPIVPLKNDNLETFRSSLLQNKRGNNNDQPFRNSMHLAFTKKRRIF